MIPQLCFSSCDRTTPRTPWLSNEPFLRRKRSASGMPRNTYPAGSAICTSCPSSSCFGPSCHLYVSSADGAFADGGGACAIASAEDSRTDIPTMRPTFMRRLPCRARRRFSHAPRLPTIGIGVIAVTTETLLTRESAGDAEGLEALAQLGHGARFELTHALARDAEHGADLLQRRRLR